MNMRDNTPFSIRVSGFEAQIHWSSEDNVYVGHLILQNQKHSACFSSIDVPGLKVAMKEAVECYLEAIEEFGDEGNILIVF